QAQEINVLARILMRRAHLCVNVVGMVGERVQVSLRTEQENTTVPVIFATVDVSLRSLSIWLFDKLVDDECRFRITRAAMNITVFRLRMRRLNAKCHQLVSLRSEEHT